MQRTRILAAHRLLRIAVLRIRALASVIVLQCELAINISKPYKPRKIKNDMIHKLGRQLYKLKAKNPGWERKTALYRKKYLQKNGRALKRRHEYVEGVRQRMGLNHKKPGQGTSPTKPVKPTRPEVPVQPTKPTSPSQTQ